MAPKLTEDEIDDLIYFARAGEDDDLTETLKELAEREKVTAAEILVAAKDESNKSTSLHMATGNGHLGNLIFHPVFTVTGFGRLYSHLLLMTDASSRNRAKDCRMLRQQAQGGEAGLPGRCQRARKHGTTLGGSGRPSGGGEAPS